MALLKTTIVIWSDPDTWEGGDPENFDELCEVVGDDEAVVARVTNQRVELPELDKDWTEDAADYFGGEDEEDGDGEDGDD